MTNAPGTCSSTNEKSSAPVSGNSACSPRSAPNTSAIVSPANAASAASLTVTIADAFGPGQGEIAEFPITGAEDFSFVLDEVPGAFVFLGACPPDRDPESAPTNHSALALFDDTALAEGTALYAELALRRLAQG